MISLKEIEKAKHIVILTDNTSFCNASALYTFILRLHKKVSLSSQDTLDKKYAFLPWFEKSRTVSPSGADLEIRVGNESLLDFFLTHEQKINQKMALALYAGLLEKMYSLQNTRLNGMFFARMGELLELGANHEICIHYLYKCEPLSLYRLKAKMFANMLLREEAQESCFVLSQEDLIATGCSLEDAFVIMEESLKIAHVKQAILIDEKNKLIKKIEDTHFGI